MSVIYVNPVDSCQLCNATFGNDHNEQSVMYDARLVPYHTWANICQACFTEQNCQIGLGKGQRYELQDLSDGMKGWVKVES